MTLLEVYERLCSLQDLMLWLLAKAVVHNLEVDIVSWHGNVASTATHAAVGSILEETICKSPDGITPQRAKQN
jgi:hypothetical protein